MLADIGGIGLLARVEISARQERFHIVAIGILPKHGLDLGDGLRIQLALHVHVRKRAARHADLGRLHAIAPAEQAAQFTLNGRIRGLALEGALHVPDGIIEFPLIVTDDAHAHVGHEIIGDRHQGA